MPTRDRLLALAGVGRAGHQPAREQALDQVLGVPDLHHPAQPLDRLGELLRRRLQLAFVGPTGPDGQTSGGLLPPGRRRSIGRHQRRELLGDVVDAGDVRRLEVLRVRHGYVGCGDPCDRRAEPAERPAADLGGDDGAPTTGVRVRLDGGQPAGPLHRGEHAVDVPRHDAWPGRSPRRRGRRRPRRRARSSRSGPEPTTRQLIAGAERPDLAEDR